MTKEVEMADSAATSPAPELQKEAPKTSLKPPPDAVLSELNSIVSLIERAVSLKEIRIMARAIRLLMALRRKLTATTLTNFVTFSLSPDSESRTRLLKHLAEESSEMDVDGGVSASSDGRHHHNKASVGALPETECTVQLVVLIYLIDKKRLEEAKECASAAVKQLQKFNRRTLDVLASRVYFYYSLAYERTNSLAEIRSTLLALNRTATLRHDEIGQETILNLLLRNYLDYNLYDQAEKLRSKVQRPESHSNQQYCRYLFYLGRIRAIQLEYTDAKDCLLQAARKAPLKARGFRIACTKWAALVRLLLGEIPERTIFMVPGMRATLHPYFELTNAVRIGDLELFRAVAEKHASVFQQDRTQNLIVRLRHNVIRTGLRRINVSYSKISLADVASKLHLDSPSPVDDAESIVAKAISDGGIDAIVDHQASWMQSKETSDIYSTVEPQAAFHSRIAFCLNTHNEAIKAMRFPPDAHREQLESGEKRRERQQQEHELATHIAEEDGDDF